MSASCADDVCVTCSDSAEPALVLRLDAHDMAWARVGGTETEISVALVDATVGATVLVHAGEAIAVSLSTGSGGRDDVG